MAADKSLPESCAGAARSGPPELLPPGRSLWSGQNGEVQITSERRKMLHPVFRGLVPLRHLFLIPWKHALHGLIIHVLHLPKIEVERQRVDQTGDFFQRAQ